jgi:ribosome-binding ATPase YchF (GTP1/OBG family)
MSIILEVNLKNPAPSHLDKIIRECYNALDLITFYTIKGGKETRAWALKRGAQVLEAGRKVHSDFEKKFIKAEVINWQKLVDAGSWLEARKQGLLKVVGRDYIVEEGDIIEFKI